MVEQKHILIDSLHGNINDTWTVLVSEKQSLSDQYWVQYQSNIRSDTEWIPTSRPAFPPQTLKRFKAVIPKSKVWYQVPSQLSLFLKQHALIAFYRLLSSQRRRRRKDEEPARCEKRQLQFENSTNCVKHECHDHTFSAESPELFIEDCWRVWGRESELDLWPCEIDDKGRGERWDWRIWSEPIEQKQTHKMENNPEMNSFYRQTV